MKRLIGTLALSLGALSLGATPALADEGMWTFDNFPSKQVKEKYGFEPTQKWLDQVRLSSARIAGGCSASFVSPDGLVMTNHHCVHSCVAQLSSAKKDLVQQGFYAKTAADELQCPAMEINQLVEIKDVTARIQKATAKLSGDAFSAAQKREKSLVEKECTSGDDVRCEIVELYSGGQYHLYKYRRFQDVRLAFAPELAIAFFGGDPDNFMFPRYNLDASFVRVYEGGKPAKMENYFRWSEAGAREGELTFTSGNPGSTSRQLTAAELAFERDVILPRRLMSLAELRGRLIEFQNRGAEQKRVANTLLFGVENGFKAFKGMHEALLEPEFFASKIAEEQKLRQWVAADPKRQAKYGKAWDEIAAAQKDLAEMYEELTFIEGAGRGPSAFMSDLFGIARTLVRAGDELPKPNEKRLREYTDSSLPAVKARLFSAAPIYPEFEEAKLAFSLSKLREELGTDHPFVKETLGKESPESLARILVQGSKLADVKLRKQLFEGGAKAVAASKDPMIVLARKVDAAGRAIREKYENGVEARINKNSELVAAARFEAYGTNVYPDATFTPRVSFGTVKGYEQNGREVKPITTFAGAFERATGKFPYELPKSWLDRKSKLDLKTPYNFASTNDIIGGNSGSPVINQKAEIVGLIFDGNIQSLGGDYGFDPTVNRAVSVHSQAILEALQKVYGADRLVKELRPTAVTTSR